MIISVSRRTDIPAYFADWFFARLRDGYALTRNPMNPRQVSRIALGPDVVDCFVFWSKNPAPMLAHLDALDGYMYYFQYTLNGYNRDVEIALPPLQERIATFQALSHRLGKKRVIWRYDPILLTEKYTVDWHVQRFSTLAEQLAPWTEKCTISFLDMYASIAKASARLGIRVPTLDEKRALARGLSDLAREHGLAMDTCAEEIDLAAYHIGHGHCIDGALIGRLLGCPIAAQRDKNQRPACGCVSAIDLGLYNTCQNGCAYCYANHSPALRQRNLALYDPASPLLCSALSPNDKVTERPMYSLKETQTSLLSSIEKDG